MLARLLRRVTCSIHATLQALRGGLLVAAKPAAPTPLQGALADLVRSKPELVAENALLRQQLLVLRRSLQRPRCTPTDRTLLVLLASCVRTWRSALLIVQPDTLLRWHRTGFRALAMEVALRAGAPRAVPGDRRLDPANGDRHPLWGAERIRGELGKRGLRVAKRTIQAYLRGSRPPRPRGQP